MAELRLRGKTWTSPPPPSEAPEALIGWSIACMCENNMRGWYEIAGTGGFVDCRRDSSIATRTGGIVESHSTVEDAARWLASVTR